MKRNEEFKPDFLFFFDIRRPRQRYTLNPDRIADVMLLSPIFQLPASRPFPTILAAPGHSATAAVPSCIVSCLNRFVWSDTHSHLLCKITTFQFISLGKS